MPDCLLVHRPVPTSGKNSHYLFRRRTRCLAILREYIPVPLVNAHSVTSDRFYLRSAPTIVQALQKMSEILDAFFWKQERVTTDWFDFLMI